MKRVFQSAVLVLRPLFACLWATAPAAAQQGPPPANVVLGEAKMETAERLREVTGRLRTARRSLVATEEPGRVIAMDLNAGDAVAAGDVVARLDDQLAGLQVDRAKAVVQAREGELRERQAELERSRREVERFSALKMTAAASESELDDRRTSVLLSEARLAQAQADLATARVELAEAERALDQMTIRAPFDGRVVAKMTEVGQWVSQGSAIAEIVSLKELEGWLDVPEAYIGSVSDSGSVRVRVVAMGEEFEASMLGVVPDADLLSRLFPVRVRLENTEERLRPGMSIVGLVPTGTSGQYLTVPKDAMLRDDAGEFLFFEQGPVAMVARVRSLFGMGERVAVEAPMLRPGARVVVRGNERIFPGQPLNVLNRDEFPAAGGPGGGPPGMEGGSRRPSAEPPASEGAGGAERPATGG